MGPGGSIGLFVPQRLVTSVHVRSIRTLVVELAIRV